MTVIQQIQITPEDAEPFKSLIRDAFAYGGSQSKIELSHTGIYDCLITKLQKLTNEAFRLGAESVNCD